MKKITNIIVTAIAIIITATDNVLYRTLGYVSSVRQKKWDEQANEIQLWLDFQHYQRDRYNKLNRTNWTTKRVMNVISD